MDKLEQMEAKLCEHDFEQQHVYSCETEYDVVAIKCVKCGEEGTEDKPCVHQIGTPLLTVPQRW
jgi:hypothetical protein